MRVSAVCRDDQCGNRLTTAKRIEGIDLLDNRELVATGAANLAAGVFGAVPGSGNFSTMGVLLPGGRTVVAGVVVAVGIAGFRYGLGQFVATLPVAAVLAVVLWMGWGLVDWRLLTRAHRIERRYGAAFHRHGGHRCRRRIMGGDSVRIHRDSHRERCGTRTP